MIMPHVSNKTGICAQASTPSLSCSLEWLRFRSFPVWCKTLKTMNSVQKSSQIRNFCTEFLHFARSAKITAFYMSKSPVFVFFWQNMAFLIQTELPEWSMATLRYEPCIQFINVSQRALHIYFIDGCRVCPLDARYKNRTKQPLV